MRLTRHALPVGGLWVAVVEPFAGSAAGTVDQASGVAEIGR
jgi:hypothetical protein